jgi:hypothetical protein
MLIVLISKGRAWTDQSCAWKIRILQADVPANMNLPSENRLPNYLL